MPKRTYAVRCLLLALTLTIGIALAWGAVWGSVWDAVHARRRVAGSYEQLVVQSDGTAAIETASTLDYQIRTLRTLEGKPLERNGQLQSGDVPGPAQLAKSPLPTDWGSRVSQWTDGRTPAARWYFLHDARVQGRGWFEGFDSITKQRIGFLGCHGYSAERLGADDFFSFDARLSVAQRYARLSYSGGNRTTYYAPEEAAPGRIPMWMFYLVSAGGLWEIDLQRRNTRELVQDADLVSAGIIERAVPAGLGPQHLPEQRIVARSSTGLWIVDPRSGATRQFPLRAELRNDALQVYELDEGRLLLFAADGPPIARAGSLRLVWLDSQGKILRESAPRLKNRATATDDSWWDAAEFVSIVPIPALLGLGVFVIEPLVRLHAGTATSYTEAVAESVSLFKWLIPVIIVLAAVAGVWSYRRHRSYGQPAATAWLIFVFLLGVPGLLAYLVHRRWPVREACPACRGMVPRDRDACLACGQAFPPPRVTGTEVFA